jgi:hypothetical protein
MLKINKNLKKFLVFIFIIIFSFIFYGWPQIIFYGWPQKKQEGIPLFYQTRIAQAASIGPNSPSSADGTSQADGGTVTWTNPTYIFASDNNRATAALAKGVISYYLQATGFGFNIPSDAVINGIYVEVERSISEATSYTKDNSIKIIQGGTITGTEHADTVTTWPASNADAYKAYGSSTDLWGLTWTPAQINASDFGVAVQAKNTRVTSAYTNTAQVDHIRITVYYTLPTYTQSHYRFFQNLDSYDVGNYLASQDTAATLSSYGQAFRLRLLISVATANLATSSGAFKLQYAQQGADNACDTSFSGETYADVSTSTVIAYNDNPSVSDNNPLTPNSNDPAGTNPIVNQTYEELNNFTNSVAAIPAGQDGKWDFSLKDNGAPASTTYCFRVVKSDGTLLDAYTVIPQITTASVTISCDTPLTTTTFSTLDNNAVYTSSPNATTTVTTNNSTGFTMKVYDAGDGTNPGLYKSTSPTAIIGSANDSFADEATLSAGTSGYGIQATTTSSQITISSRFNKTGNDVGGLEVGSANAVVVASSSVPVSNQVITFIHKAAVSPTKPPGNYSDTIYIVCSVNP